MEETAVSVPAGAGARLARAATGRVLGQGPD